MGVNGLNGGTPAAFEAKWRESRADDKSTVKQLHPEQRQELRFDPALTPSEQTECGELLKLLDLAPLVERVGSFEQRRELERVALDRLDELDALARARRVTE